MSAQISQQGISNFSNVGELLLQAQQMNAAQQAHDATTTEQEKPKGLEFMAIRYNVIEKRRQLQVSRAITPAEYFILEEIELATIGAQNERRTICSMTEFWITDLAPRLGVADNKLYKNLKSLELKRLIIREKTRRRGQERIGLNPEIFGQILIDSQHEIEKTRHLHLVHNSQTRVDNSNKGVDNSGNNIPPGPEFHTEKGRNSNHGSMQGRPKKAESASQVHEITGEKALLDSSRSEADSSRAAEGGRGELHSFGDKSGSETGPNESKQNPIVGGPSPEEQAKNKAEINRQLGMLKALEGSA